jgi:hypothetical protein
VVLFVAGGNIGLPESVVLRDQDVAAVIELDGADIVPATP